MIITEIKYGKVRATSIDIDELKDGIRSKDIYIKQSGDECQFCGYMFISVSRVTIHNDMIVPGDVNSYNATLHCCRRCGFTCFFR